MTARIAALSPVRRRPRGEAVQPAARRRPPDPLLMDFAGALARALAREDHAREFPAEQADEDQEAEATSP